MTDCKKYSLESDPTSDIERFIYIKGENIEREGYYENSEKRRFFVMYAK